MSRTPRFRIHTVAEMTGIPASTLRAWERRYGIPTPERTQSAYRLYTDEDVDLLKRMKCLCEGGISPSEASRMLSPVEAPSEPAVPMTGSPYDVATQRIVHAVEAFDPALLRLEVARATYLGCASEVFERVIAPVMRTIGQGWHEGRITVAQEHMATESLLGTVRDLHRLVQPTGERTVLLACIAGESHVLPVYGVAFRFNAWGYRTEVLGANTPPEAIADAVSALSPAAIGLSMTTPRSAAEMDLLLDSYVLACQGRPWVLGGVAAGCHEEAVAARGGMVCSEDLSPVRAQLERVTLVARREVSGVH